MRSVGRHLAALGVIAACGAGAPASDWSLEAVSDLALRPLQPEDAAPEPDALTLPSMSDWKVAIEPSWWYPAMFGDLRIAGSATEADIEDLQIDEPDSAPLVEAMLRDGPYTARVSGFFFSQSAGSQATEPFTIGGVSIGAGESFSASIDYASFEATWGYLLWDKTFPDHDGQARVTMRLDGFAGLRGYDLDFSAAPQGGAGVSDDATWLDLIAGLRLEVEITREFSFDVAADIGGFAWDGATSGSANIITGFQWRPNPNIGAQIGYRFLTVDYSDGDDGDEEFEFTGSIAGLFGSLVLRF